MDYFSKLCISFLVISSSLWSIDGQEICAKLDPCSCAFPNGTGIDLKPVSKKSFYTAQMYSEKKEGKQLQLSTYYFHPCYDEVPEVNSTGPADTCNKNLTICRHVYTLDMDNVTNAFKMDAGVYNFIGSTDNVSFSANGDSLIYGNFPSKTIVLLVCAETDDKFVVNSLAEPNDLVLSLYSRAACLKKLNLPSESTRSFGTTLLIIFLSLSTFYLVLGICTKKFLMGATGIEVIPNLGFWTDLPNLVKDGWAFAIAGFKLPVRGSGPAMSPDPNSYDSI